ncbi:MAG TPA: TonB-dependent receptor [Vicinamibacteria bacterium]|nr:TonB-dependent receptor [Vicinamibacteria bacterium]
MIKWTFLALSAVLPLTSPAAAAVLADEESAQTILKVQDERGKPLAGVTVRVESATGTPLANATVSNDGTASVARLPRGRHRVVVSDSTGEIGLAVLVIGESADAAVVTLKGGAAGSAHFSEDVLVSAEAGTAQEAARTPQSTNAISKDEIDGRAKVSLAEIGNREAGLYWQRTSPTMGAIFIRGLTGAKVNLFIDGVRFSNAAARGGVNTFLNLLDPSLIESAEVTRGPSSAQYGSDAMGGSVQLYSKAPVFSSAGSVFSGRASLSAGSADRSGGAEATVSWSTPIFSLVAAGTGRKVGDIRTGDGIDSHHAVTRFFGVPSSAVQDDRLPDTSFDQYGGSVRAAWSASPNVRFFGTYLRGQIDGSKRYDQLLGGDGNLIADVRDLKVDIATVRYEHLNPGFADLLSVSYSFNAQFEERVNQGGNGNPAAAINHEPERTTTNAIQIRAQKAFGSHTLSAGGDFSFEEVTGVSVAENATTGATTVRRGRVPDGAQYRGGGIYVQDSFDPSPKAHLVGAVRASFARYESFAATAPVVNGQPLWPDDKLNASSVTFRLGATYELADGLRAIAHVGRGFRAPHITDLATLGLTGAGFEASYDSVAPLGASIGTTADAAALSTGRSVAVLEPETSLTWEFGFHLNRGPIETRNTVFWNDIKGNIEKYSAILPPGSVGKFIGSEVITSQLPNGVVFVSLSPNPVLIRANQENSRIFGIEHEANVKVSNSLSLRTSATYLHAELTSTGEPPNIEGGTPNPDAWIALRWTSKSKALYVEPYAHLAAEQKRLSTLDLGDRRTGASRSRSSITSFFNNGAKARGYTSPGADGRFGTADDTLIATGETLPQIITRVLGPSGATNSLYTTVHGYQVFGVRAGWTIAKRHQITIDFDNLTDQNYRGPSWGMDASGRNVFARYSVKF